MGTMVAEGLWRRARCCPIARVHLASSADTGQGGEVEFLCLSGPAHHTI